MKFPKHHKLRPLSPLSPVTQLRQLPCAAPVDAASSLPVVVASAFPRLHLTHRARVLRRLLMPVGPMALVVLGGGVFAKYAAQARWARMSVSLEDAARVSSNQILELVHYVEQSNPRVLYDVLVLVARDPSMTTAVGASVAALMLQHLALRKPALGPPA